MNNSVIVRKNERSWAIEMISQINAIVGQYDLKIKRAGGESTISYNAGKSMFPDVVLYEDEELTTILQGWELKMPDVPITDETFVKDAQRKARALNLSSCLIWNFTYAQFFVLNPDTNEFEMVRQWENLQIAKRPDVALYRTDWMKTLEEIVIYINNYLLNHSVSKVSIGDILSQGAINLLINNYKVDVANHLKTEGNVNAVLDAWIAQWWKETKEEYEFDEKDAYWAYAKTMLINWAYRIMFAHLIKSRQNAASLVNEINYDTTPQEANHIFSTITSKCDFYNVFEGVKFADILPEQVWQSLVELSLFLQENGIRTVDQKILQNILEGSVNTSRREINGQYPTPPILARVLARITVHNWTDDFIDPCCGTGTIPHEVIQLKRDKIGIENAVITTWASDKYKLPLQIANISMVSYDTINMANRIFQKNALSLRLGDNIDIVNPQDGNTMHLSLPQFGAICSNLPFVSGENIPVEDISFINENMKDNHLDGRSDVSYFIANYLSNILSDKGYIGIITSNSWLGTFAGKCFYHELLKSFYVRQVHISGRGRWFKNADVVTTLIVLQNRKAKEGNDNTSFYIWKYALEEIQATPSIEEDIVQSSLLGTSVNQNVIQKSEYTQEQIGLLQDINLSFNSLFHDVSWVLNIQDKLIPVTNLFKMIRGSRRGWDAMFFPQEKNRIEDNFKFPALFNAKSVKRLIATPDREAFCCSENIESLRNDYPGTFEWIQKFSSQKNNVGIPLTKCLKTAELEWYEMQPKEVADIFTMMNPNNRFFFGRFEKPSFINQRLIGMQFKDRKTDAKLCHALLNTVLIKFFIEALGFGRGLGVLDINKDGISKCMMLNPEMLSVTSKERIKMAFDTILAKDIIDIDQELHNPEWIAFNKLVLREFGIESYYNAICDSLKSLRKVRYAVKEKISNPQIQTIKDTEQKVVQTYPLHIETEMAMAAEGFCHYGSVSVILPKTSGEQIVSNNLNLVLMYAIGSKARKHTQESAKIALGIKENKLTAELQAAYLKVKYVMFHYWKNESASAFELTAPVRIVSETEIPKGFLRRQEKEAQKYLLLEYNPKVPINLGETDILKVQIPPKSVARYLPFIVKVEDIKLN